MAKRAAVSTSRFDTSTAGVIAPERGPVLGRLAVILLPTLLVAGMLAGLIPMLMPSADSTDVVTKGMIAASVGLGALGGLAAWLLMMFPSVMVIGVTKDFMARSDGRARLVLGLLWLATSLLALVGIYLVIGGINQVATLFGPSALLVGLVMVVLAPWVVWKRWRRPRNALDM